LQKRIKFCCFRYLYITRCLKYHAIVTRFRIFLAISLSWLLPAIYSIYSVLIYRNTGEANCVLSSMVSNTFMIILSAFVLSLFIVMYILYTIILFKFFKRKKMLEKYSNFSTGTIRMEDTFQGSIKFSQSYSCCFYKTIGAEESVCDPPSQVILTSFRSSTHVKEFPLLPSEVFRPLSTPFIQHVSRVARFMKAVL